MATTITGTGLNSSATPLQTVTPTPDLTNYGGIIQSALDSVSGYQSAYDTATANDAATAGKIQTDQNTLLGKTADTQAFNDQYGVTKATSDINNYVTQLAGVNANISGLANEAKAIPLDVQNKAANTGATDAGVAPITTGRLRENAIKALTQSSLADVLTANITGSQIALSAAQQKVQQALDLKYKPIEDEITNLQNQLALNKQYITDPAEKKLASAQQKILDERARQIAEQKQTESDIAKVVQTASANGAPKAVVDAMSKAKDVTEATRLATGWLSDPLDRQYKQAQIAKIKNDIATSGASSLDPAGVLAYAQQYAADGKIPTGLPKGTFGLVANVAKELPKAAGTVVDKNTGIKSGNLSPTQDDAIAALYDVTNKDLPALLQKFNSINTGVLGGIGGALVGSQDRQDFKTLKQEIVNKLLKARSGAAVSDNEYKRYVSMLPTSFNQPLFLGTDGAKKIQSLQTALNGSLDSTLSTNGLAVYGYSKVNIGGNQYTVGDIVQNSNGQSGRINPDGSITYITQ